MQLGISKTQDRPTGLNATGVRCDDPVREWRLIQILCDNIPLNEADRADLELTWRLRFGGLDARDLAEEELMRLTETSARVMRIAEDHYRALGLRISH